MSDPFTNENGRSCGIDELHAEHIKFAPDSVHRSTANISNQTVKGDEHPEELKIGILTPLPKPSKKNDHPPILDQLFF